MYSIGIGYGIPDDNFPTDPDADGGSFIGYLWWSQFEKDELKANIATRTTVGVLKALCFLSIPLITGAWTIYATCVSFMVLNRVLWGAIIPDEGMFNFMGKRVLVEEADIHFGDGFFIVLMILLSANTLL